MKNEIIKAIIAKAERICEIHSVDNMTGEEIDELVILEHTLPHEVLAIKSELLSLLKEG